MEDKNPQVSPIQDTSIPILSSPEDKEYEEGSIGQSILWYVGDNDPGMYSVTMDGNIYSELAKWDNGFISTSINGLTAGIYVFIISISDINGNVIFDSVVVTVTGEISTGPPGTTESTSGTTISSSTGGTFGTTLSTSGRKSTDTNSEGIFGLRLNITPFIFTLVILIHIIVKRRKMNIIMIKKY